MNTASYSDEILPLRSRNDAADYDTVDEERVSDAEHGPSALSRAASKMAEIEDELRLAASVETELRAVFPCEVVQVDDGVFLVDVEAPLLWEDRLVEDYNAVAEKIPGVRGVRIHILPSSIHGQG
ncbi:MAG: hypothetical protein P8182_10775 [Deltaproteobacteria bacterium]